MAEPLCPIHSFEFEPGRRHSTDPLSNVRSHLHEPRFPPRPHYTLGWRPTTTDEFNAWNASHQGTFPSTLIGPGQNPGQDPPPHPQLRHPACATNIASLRKRKRTTPSSLGETSSVGGYGPLLPGGTTTETSSPSPSPPPFTSVHHHNVAYDVWAFAQPLLSEREPPADQWPRSMELHLRRKPNTPWFGCKLCSQFGYDLSICLWKFYANSHMV